MKLGTKIKKINSDKFTLVLCYVDGFQGSLTLDFIFNSQNISPLILEILRGNLFSKCFIENGAIAWPNGYELCPDALRAWIIEQAEENAA